MSLRLKFGILLSVLATAVALAIGVSWWAVAKLETEVREPFRGMSQLLVSLGDIKHEVETLGQCVGGGHSGLGGVRSFLEKQTHTPTEQDLMEFNAAAEKALAILDRIQSRPEDSSEWAIRAGRNALSNVRSRLGDAIDIGRDYVFKHGQAVPSALVDGTVEDPERRRAGQALYDIHELIERLEAKVISDTKLSLDYGDTIRLKLLGVMGTIVLVAFLTAILGLVLIRRWVLTPIDHLRTATAKLAAGDFTHRVPPSSSADELAKLGVEVNQMAGMIKTMQDDRVEQERLAAIGEMVRRLAHNLRNPLGGIRGLAEITRAELRSGPAVDPDLIECQSKIIQSVDRFEKWLNELLNVTRPSRIRAESTQIAPWLTGLVDAHQPLAQTRGVGLLLNLQSAPLTADFDQAHLEHAISAILSNAIEAAASPQARGPQTTGGNVRVVASVGEDGETWQISVADTGPGIPADLRDRIFRPYFTTKKDGNGIGLAVAQQVVKGHGGRIWVESPVSPPLPPPEAVSDDGRRPPGALFIIRLPLHRPVVASPEQDEATSGQVGDSIGQHTGH